MPHLQHVLRRDVCDQLPVAHGHPSICALLPSEASCNHTGNGAPSLSVCPLVDRMSMLLRVASFVGRAGILLEATIPGCCFLQG